MNKSRWGFALWVGVFVVACGLIGPSLSIPPTRSDRRTPPRTSDVGAGTRSLFDEKQGLVALIPTRAGWKAVFPDELEGKELDIGVISRNTPTFWFYLPSSCPQDVPNCSLLFDIYEERIDWRNLPRDYPFKKGEIKLPLPEKSGFVPVSIPEGFTSFEEGALYYWRLRIVDEDNQPIGEYGTTGPFEIRKPSEELVRELASAKSERERYLAYEGQGMMFAAIDGVLQESQSISTDEQIRDDWHRLLRLMELSCTELSNDSSENSNVIETSCQDLTNKESDAEGLT